MKKSEKPERKKMMMIFLSCICIPVVAVICILFILLSETVSSDTDKYVTGNKTTALAVDNDVEPETLDVNQKNVNQKNAVNDYVYKKNIADSDNNASVADNNEPVSDNKASAAETSSDNVNNSESVKSNEYTDCYDEKKSEEYSPPVEQENDPVPEVSEECEHVWVDIVKQENVLIADEWEEEVEGDAYWQCTCGHVSYSASENGDHQEEHVLNGEYSYSWSLEHKIDYIHHDAEYITNNVVTGQRCSKCGLLR